MTTITREVRINAPKEKVWAALADFGGIHVFNPGVSHSYSTSDQNRGVGAQRHCDLAIAGASIEERVLEWVDGEKMIIEIYAGKKTPPFKSAFATIAVHSAGSDTAVVRGDFEYTMKFGPIGGLINVLMVKPQFGKAWSGVFAGLKHFVETGQKVDSPKGLDFGAVQMITA